jgi:MSHA biogenesis protein MshN
MSLINEMLQALEQRQDRPPEPSTAVRVAAPPVSGGPTRWLWLGGTSLLLLAFATGWLLRERPQSDVPQAPASPAEVKAVVPVPLPTPTPNPVEVVSIPKQGKTSDGVGELPSASLTASRPQQERADGDVVPGRSGSSKVAESNFDHPHPNLPPQGEGAGMPPSSHPSPQDNTLEVTRASPIASLPPRGRTGGGESNKAAATDQEGVGKTANGTSPLLPAEDKPPAKQDQPPRTAVAATAPKPPLGGAEGAAHLKHTTPRQRAEQAYQQALIFQREGRDAEAIEALHRTLQLEPEHAAARQSLAVQLAESGEADTAEALLKEGMELEPAHPGLSMSLARLMVERGEDAGALELLDRQGDVAHAGGEYQALYAALLQRAGRHTDAMERYRRALGTHPASAPNWAGLGISLRATGQTQAARESLQRALQVGGLDPALESFVRESLRELRGEGSE